MQEEEIDQLLNQAEAGDGPTAGLDVTTAIARLEILERSAERLRAWLLTNDLRAENPKVVEETVNRSLQRFTEAIEGRLAGHEKQLEALVARLNEGLAEFVRALRQDIGHTVDRIESGFAEGLERLGGRMEGLESRAADLELRLVEAIGEIPKGGRTNVEELSGNLAQFARALREALRGSVGQIQTELAEGLSMVRERIESLEPAGAGSEDGELVAAVRQATERAELTSAEARAHVDELTGRLAEFAGDLREALLGSVGGIQAELTEALGSLRERIDGLEQTAAGRRDAVELESLRGVIERLEGSVAGRIDETASVREVVDRIEGDVARGVDQTASVREVAERLEGLVAGRIDEIASVREAIERIQPTEQVDVQALTAGLSEPVDGLRGALEVAVVEIREGFATVVAELRQRIESLGAVSYRADEATLHTVREGIERMELASRDDVEGLTSRLSALEEGLRDTFLNSLGGIRMQLDDGMTAISQRVDAVERVVADQNGEAQIASVREAIERVERTSREGIEALSQRLGEFSGTMNDRLGRFVGTLNEQLGVFAQSLSEKLGTDTLRESLLDEIQMGVTSVIVQLRERIDSLEANAREQAAAVRALESQIGRGLEGLTGAFEKLVGSVETLERWWGDPRLT